MVCNEPNFKCKETPPYMPAEHVGRRFFMFYKGNYAFSAASAFALL